MLTNQRSKDDFSLLIGAGAFLRDNDDLISDIDDFQKADERRITAIESGDLVGATKSILEMRAIILGIDSKVIAPEASGVLAMGIAFDSFAMAVSVRADAIAAGAVSDLSCQLGSPDCNFEELFSEDFNILNIEGVLATEFGVSFAKSFQLINRKLSIGLKPKVVNLQRFSFKESILTASTGINSVTAEEDKVDIGNFSTVDLGLALDLTDVFRLGLNFRNLLSNSFDFKGQTLDFDTEARVGVSYRNRIVTVAMDYDLFENEPLLANKSFKGLQSRYVALGAEFNVYDYLKLRIGTLKNLAGGISGGAKDSVYTFGLGLWLGFNVDVAAVVTNQSFGGFLQTGSSF